MQPQCTRRGDDVVKARVTVRDENLPHQIRLVQLHNGMTGVGCNCRPGAHLATIRPDEDPWPHYNNAQHNNSKERFVTNSVNSKPSEVFDVK